MIIAIDLGGTKMLTALIDKEMKIHGRMKVPTPQTTEGDDILYLIRNNIDLLLKTSALKQSDFEGVAVCVPSPINIREGRVLLTPNIGFRNYPLQEKLQKMLGVKVIVENDVNAGLYGEFKRGTGRGKKHIVGIYPGTGIGGAMILDSKLYYGASGGAGEIGHMTIQSGGRLCGCGHYGCLETLASKTALAKELVQLAISGKSPTIYEAVGYDYTKIKSSHIQKAIKAGEQEVISLVNRAAEFLGIGMANCVNIFNPEMIILGGGLIEKLGNDFVKRAEKSMRMNTIPHLLEDVEVGISNLGDDTVIIGAGLLFFTTLR